MCLDLESIRVTKADCFTNGRNCELSIWYLSGEKNGSVMKVTFDMYKSGQLEGHPSSISRPDILSLDLVHHTVYSVDK